MARKKAEVEEITQRIDEDLLGDITQYPSQVRRWFTSNIIQRTFAYLFGWTEEGKPRRLMMTSDGRLKVSTTGTGLTDYKEFHGNAQDDYTGENILEFDKTYTSFDILAEGGDLIISMKKEDGTWGDERIVKEGIASFDFVVKGIKVKNRDAGTNVFYEIVVYR